MFAFVPAFPKSLHCTDEAQQDETVLSAVFSIYMYIYMCVGMYIYLETTLGECRINTTTGERKK